MTHENILEDEVQIDELLARTRRVAVLGMKTEEAQGQPAFEVPRYLASVGLEVIPVPVYYPDATEILGRPVYRQVRDVPGALDVVDVFRRPKDLEAHVEDLLAARPAAVWFQLGIRNDAVARRLAEGGVKVVQDRCLKVDYARWLARGRPSGR